MAHSILFTRPAAWEGLKSKNTLLHVPIGGLEPKRNSGKPAGDGIGVVALPGMVKLLTRMLAKLQPDVFVRAVHQKFDGPMMNECRKASPNTLFCLMEGNNPDGVSKFVKRFRKTVDAVLINSWHPETIDAYLKDGVAVVPGFWDGFTPTDHVRKSVKKAEFDCFFGGSNHHTADKWRFPNGSERCDFLTKISDRFSLLVDGPFQEWTCFLRGGTTTVQAPRSHLPYLADMQRARILIGYNHLDLERYYTRRTIHSGASGRLLITRVIAGMDKDFPDGGPVQFSTNDEGVDVVKHMLAHPGKREALAARQKMAFMKYHTWEARLRRFEQLLPRLLNRKVECVY
jgi:hypothetical protein